MKLKLGAALALATIAHISMAGIFWSKFAAPKIHIASAETLIARFEKIDVSYEEMQDLKLIETFAGKKLSQQEIKNKLAHIFNDIWDAMEADVKRQRVPQSEIARMYGEFRKDYAITFPPLVQLLCQQDEPAALENISTPQENT